jgi:hypothetical protein
MIDQQHVSQERAEGARPIDRPAQPAPAASPAAARRQLNLRTLMPTFLDDPVLWRCHTPTASPARRSE